MKAGRLASATVGCAYWERRILWVATSQGRVSKAGPGAVVDTCAAITVATGIAVVNAKVTARTTNIFFMIASLNNTHIIVRTG